MGVGSGGQFPAPHHNFPLALQGVGRAYGADVLVSRGSGGQFPAPPPFFRIGDKRELNGSGAPPRVAIYGATTCNDLRCRP